MEKKVCFVAMGFGKKMDYRNSREIDLDVIYKKVIKALFESELPEYVVIRADEISGSEIIDVSMYALLMKADLVIADITTMNENAIYELGVRHAVRPYSTIIMMQKNKEGYIPFDLSHSRVLAYEDFGEKLDGDEARAIMKKLKEFVKASEEGRTDSPLYTYLPNVVPPQISDEEYHKLIDDKKQIGESIADLISEAEAFKDSSRFKEAAGKWERLHEMIPNNTYVIQQWALAQYKSKQPSETMALDAAESTIKLLNPKTSLDLETLGITGAIYKRLFKLNKNYEYLDEAIGYYQKAFMIKKDYYNGENYSNCLILKTGKPGIPADEAEYLKYESKRVCREIIGILKGSIEENEVNIWMYATLAVCYFTLGDFGNYEVWREKFIGSGVPDWEQETFNSTISDIKGLIGA